MENDLETNAQVSVPEHEETLQGRFWKMEQDAEATRLAQHSPEEAPADSRERREGGFTRRNTLLGGGLGALGLIFGPAFMGGKSSLPSADAAIADKLRAGNVNFEWHIARRCTYRASEAMMLEIKQAGWSTWLRNQIYSPASFNDNNADKLFRDHYKYGFYDHTYFGPSDTERWRYAYAHSNGLAWRRLYTNRHLQEKMTEFWLDLVSIYKDTNGTSVTSSTYGNGIRARALGKFSDLLYFSTQSPAMHSMLTNTNNRKNAMNENYGREILELHTLGFGSGYTETDVKEASKLFTGYGLNYPDYTLKFTPSYHYYGPVKVLGWSHANGQDTTHTALMASFTSYLANHDKTAERICKRLIKFFVTPEESGTAYTSLLASLIKVYKDNATDIRPVLWSLFNSDLFKNSIGAQFSRPSAWIPKMIHASTTGWNPTYQQEVNPVDTQRNATGLQYASWLQQAGHLPLSWGAPNGFPQHGPHWVSTNNLSLAQKIAQSLSWRNDKSFLYPADWATAIGVGRHMTSDAVVKRLFEYFFGFAPSAEEKAAVKKMVERAGKDDEGKIPQAIFDDANMKPLVHMVMGSPHAFVA